MEADERGRRWKRRWTRLRRVELETTTTIDKTTDINLGIARCTRWVSLRER
jgi:hypothetical protein